MKNAMKTIWYEKQGAPGVLQFGETEKPAPQSGEVLVRVCASGVNPSDVKTRAGARGAMPFPRQIPHSDGAGIIETTGKNVSAERIGGRVWLWNAAIGRAFGTCAEYICIPEKQAVPLHQKTSFAEGACFGVPLMTAVYGVCTACNIYGGEEIKGKTVLITGGAGAVGFYAIQAAKLRGATVITTISGDSKKAHAAQANPDYIINYKTEDAAARILEITGGKGADGIVEVEFGGNLEISAKALKAGGTIATYGSAANPTPALPFYPFMFNNAALKMFFIYKINEEARQKTLNLIKEIEPELTHAVAETFPLIQTQKAHEKVESGEQIGNVVVEVKP